MNTVLYIWNVHAFSSSGTETVKDGHVGFVYSFIWLVRTSVIIAGIDIREIEAIKYFCSCELFLFIH
jgi:hypothetical protein